jgi:hypothetical protein
MMRYLLCLLALPALLQAAPTNSFWNVNTSNLVVKAINLNGSNITAWSQVGGTSGTTDHSALSNLVWTASGHTGTPARIAGFLEGGSPGYVGFGAGLYLDGSDNITISNAVLIGAAAGATAVQPAAIAGMLTNGMNAAYLPDLYCGTGFSFGTPGIARPFFQYDTNTLTVSFSPNSSGVTNFAFEGVTINGTATVAQTALAGWPTQWSGGSITSAVANATTATVWTASGGYVQTNHTGNTRQSGVLSIGNYTNSANGDLRIFNLGDDSGSDPRSNMVVSLLKRQYAGALTENLIWNQTTKFYELGLPAYPASWAEVGQEGVVLHACPANGYITNIWWEGFSVRSSGVDDGGISGFNGAMNQTKAPLFAMRQNPFTAAEPDLGHYWLNANETIPLLSLWDSGGNAAAIDLRKADSATTGPYITLAKAKGTLLVPTIVATNSILGGIKASAYNGSTYSDVAAMWFAMNGAAASTNLPTLWRLDLTPQNSTTRGQVLKVAHNGSEWQLVFTGALYADGSGLTNLPPDASKANSNSVVTVVQTNSAGVAVTNQFTIGNANPTIVLPTISAAGGATTPWTNSVMFRTGSFRNATTNDFLGGIITGNETLDTASGASVALFNTVANAATNIYSGSAWFVFPWPAGNDMTTLQLGFRKSGTTATNFPLTLMYSNRLTQATASMVLTGAAPLADTTYWTNMSIASSICTQAVQGSEWILQWDASFGATTNTTPGYMGVSIQGILLK